MRKCSNYGDDYFVNKVDLSYASPINSVLAKPTKFKFSIYTRVRDKPMNKILVSIKFIIRGYISRVQMRGRTKLCVGVCAIEGQCSSRKDSRSTTLSIWNWLVFHNVQKVPNRDHDARRSSKWYWCEMTSKVQDELWIKKHKSTKMEIHKQWGRQVNRIVVCWASWEQNCKRTPFL